MHESTKLSGIRETVAKLEPAELANVRRIQPNTEAALDVALEHFYGVIRHNPKMKSFFSDDQHMSDARNRQKQHWLALTRGELGASHLERTHRIGQAHARIGLEPQYFIAGYGSLLGSLVRQTIKSL